MATQASDGTGLLYAHLFQQSVCMPIFVCWPFEYLRFQGNKPPAQMCFHIDAIIEACFLIRSSVVCQASSQESTPAMSRSSHQQLHRRRDTED